MQFNEIIFFLILFSAPSFSESLYKYYSDNQSISHDKLNTRLKKNVSNFYDINLIISSTPSIKFYINMLNQENLPIDLAVIPLLESGNNPQARSPKDALGLWQFIPATAKEWGLLNNIKNDERSNVIKSTNIAIQYLRYLHEQLKDWNLALAAYNWGIGNVKKSIKKGLIKNNAIDLDMLPKETRRYLLAFHHLNKLIKEYYKKRALGKFPNRNYLDTIKQKDLKEYIANNKITNTNSDVLMHINGFDVTINKEKNKDILVPNKEFKKYFSLDTLQYSKVKKQTNNGGGCRQKFYKSKKGDTLYKIARRFNLKFDAIAEMNPKVKYVRPGMSLQICR